MLYSGINPTPLPEDYDPETVNLPVTRDDTKGIINSLFIRKFTYTQSKVMIFVFDILM